MESLQFLTDKQQLSAALASGKRTRIEVELSPEMVEHLLAMNSERNRKPTLNRIRDIAAKISQFGFLEVDEFKFFEGGLVNGQHRLRALEKLYKDNAIQRPYPRNFIVVNIPNEEAVLIDTAQARNMDQRIYMATGKKPHKSVRAAAFFLLKYHKPDRHHARVSDAEVIQEMESNSWQEFIQEISPDWKMPNSLKKAGMIAPVYAAFKEAFDRADHATWNNLLNELNGHMPGVIVQKLRSLIENGCLAINGKDSGSAPREFMYRLSVTFLKAYLNGLKRVGNDPSDWDD